MSEAVDLKVVRAYEKYGIKVLVEIDFVEKTVTLVERKTGRFANRGYEPKSWQFEGRTVDYLNGWIAIFRAMEYATTEAEKELEAAEEKDRKQFLDLMVKLSEIDLESEDAKS